MKFTLSFLQEFFATLWLVGPVLASLVLAIVILGLVIGRKEKWSQWDSLYYAFITATTVGYGDFRPHYRRTKLMAIAIALVGILLTGIVVAVGLRSLDVAFRKRLDAERIEVLSEQSPAYDGPVAAPGE